MTLLYATVLRKREKESDTISSIISSWACHIATRKKIVKKERDWVRIVSFLSYSDQKENSEERKGLG